MGDHRRLHDLLTELRHRAGDPSLRKINAGCGVSVGYLSQIFAGKTVPGPDVAVRVAQALKATDREQARIRYYAEGTEADRAARRTVEAARPRRPGWEGCPYRGLLPFEEQHATVFYGRRALTTRLLDRLLEHPADAGILLVLGPSGAGKSSLLRAGLMGSLAADTLTPGCRNWPRRVITPTSDPLQQLAVHLAELATADAISVRHALTEHPEKANLLAGQALAATGGRLVLVVDQLEELFTLTSDPTEQQAFLTALHSLATEPVLPDGGPGALIVAGIRADFLEQALTHAPIRQATEAGVFTVGALSESELREAIVGPAAEAGLRIPDDLCAAILDDLRERNPPSGFDCGALPLLSQVMFVMWQNKGAAGLTVAGYHRTGGVADIVRTSAEQAYDSLDPGRRDLARLSFIHLTSVTEDRLTRRPGTRAALRAATDSEDIDSFLEAFVAQRLLTISDNGTVTIAHEELLRSWKRLHDWLQPDATDRALHQALTDDVHDWQQRRRDPSYLYQGARLLAVEDALPRWVDDPAQHFRLDPATTDFLDASRRRASRRRLAYRTVAAALALLSVLTAAAAVYATNNADIAERERAVALSRQLAAQSANLLPGNSELADLLAVQAYNINRTDEAVDSLYAAVAQPVVRTLAGHTDAVSAVTYSPDGHQVASASRDNTVRVWNLDTGESHELPTYTAFMYQLVYSPVGQYLAGASDDGRVRVWDLGSGESRTVANGIDDVHTLAYSPDGRFLASAGDDRVICIWNLGTGKPQKLTGHPGSISAVAYSPDGRSLAAGGVDQPVRVWDLATGKSRELRGHTGGVSSVVYSPDGRFLASAGDDKVIRIWDVTTWKSRELRGHTGGVSSLAYSLDGRHLASTGIDQTIRVWNTATGTSRIITSGTDLMHGVAFSHDGRHLASAGSDSTLRLWDIEGRDSATLTGHTGSVTSVAYSSDGRYLASAADDDGTVRVWDLATRESRNLTGRREGVYSVRFSPDQRYLIGEGSDADLADGSISEGGRWVTVWDLATGRSRELPGFIDWLHSLAHSPAGPFLVAAGTDADDDVMVRIWDLSTGKSRDLIGFTGSVDELAYSPDGRYVAGSAYTDGETDTKILVWDVSTGKSRELAGIPGSVHELAYSPDGRHLVGSGTIGINYDPKVWLWDVSTGNARELSGDTDTDRTLTYSRDGRYLMGVGYHDGIGRKVRVWDLGTGDFRELTLHTGEPSALAYSPDGRSVAAAGTDKTIRVWDLGTGASRVLTGHTNNVTALVYSPDGLDLVSAGRDKTIRIWANAGLTPVAAINLICGTLGRDLTAAERRTYLHSAGPDVRACPGRPR